MKVAVVHEWLLDYAGSERVVREILEVLPQADLFALIDRRDAELAAAIPRKARTSFLQRLPQPAKMLRYYVPLMPLAVKGLDVSAYDLVISSSHAVAKGVRTGKGQLHISYVHTPMRYAWDLRDEYLRAAGLDRGPGGWAARAILERLRRWDERSADGVDLLIANSAHVAARIRAAYGREAEVLHPPVDVAGFPLRADKEDFYLTVSRLEPYKRVDLLVDAFSRDRARRLVVVGSGSELQRLKARASPNVTFTGRLPTSQVVESMQRARAFLFAGIEDFGIVMAEAQACGTPVIAFNRGGAAEIVRPDTGVLFDEQTPEAVLAAVEQSEAQHFDCETCRTNALRFDRPRFREGFRAYLGRQSAMVQGSGLRTSTTSK
jgi:glycosyltransferase involved in cell wall biosynthesis